MLHAFRFPEHPLCAVSEAQALSYHCIPNLAQSVSAWPLLLQLYRFPCTTDPNTWPLLITGSAADAVQQPLQALGFKGSVYAVAMDSVGTVLAAGTPDSALRICDPRTGGKVCKLRGHTDTIR